MKVDEKADEYKEPSKRAKTDVLTDPTILLEPYLGWVQVMLGGYCRQLRAVRGVLCWHDPGLAPSVLPRLLFCFPSPQPPTEREQRDPAVSSGRPPAARQPACLQPPTNHTNCCRVCLSTTLREERQRSRVCHTQARADAECASDCSTIDTLTLVVQLQLQRPLEQSTRCCHPSTDPQDLLRASALTQVQVV